MFFLKLKSPIFVINRSLKYGKLLKQNSDYYSFGSPMPGRNAPGNYSYKYGFNGKEKDDEIKGGGNSYDFGARIYDSRLGRWLAIDPEAHEFAAFSPYNFSFNNPIIFTDPDGESPILKIFISAAKNAGKVGAKLIAPELAEMLIKHGAKKALKNYVSKGFYKRLASDLNDAVGVFTDSPLEIGISLIPVAGDVYDAGKLIKNNPKFINKLTEAVVKFQKSVYRIESALINSSTKLREALKLTDNTMQAHHIIPTELLEKNDVVADAVAAGFDFNGITNGIALKTYKKGNDGVHANHPEYTKQVLGKIENWSKQNKDYTPEQAKEFLEGLTKDLKETIQEKSVDNGNKLNTIKL